MLTKIEAKGFKVFGEGGISLPLSPLTMLLGPNGSGKSSLFDAISLIAQSARNNSQQNGFGWNGELVDFNIDGAYAFHNRLDSVPLCIGVTLEANAKRDYLHEWQRKSKRIPDHHFQIRQLGYSVSYTKATEEWTHQLLVDDSEVARNYISVTNMVHGYSSQAHLKVDPKVVDFVPDARRGILSPTSDYAPSESGARVLSPGLFNPSGPLNNSQFDGTLMPRIGGVLGLLVSFMRDFLAERVFVVGADRMPSRHTDEKKWTGDTRLYVGRNGEHTLAILSYLLASPDLSAEAEVVRHWASVFGLHNLKSCWVGNGLRAGFQDPQSKTPLQLQYSGFGSQQILPVITQLFCSPPGSVVMIEEPEVSLHPEAQVQLLRMFAHAVESGRQVLFTTHSPTVVLSLAEASAGHHLEPSAAGVLHFSREESGDARVQKLDLDDRWFVKGWIPSFSKVETDLMKRWIATVHDEVAKES
jgi:predicted ATPase